MATRLYQRMINAADKKLRTLLTDVDSFWIKWGYWKEQVELQDWISVNDHLPTEVFSYGMESETVIAAFQHADCWQYYTAYCVRGTSGVSWYTTHSVQIYPTHWRKITPPFEL